MAHGNEKVEGTLQVNEERPLESSVTATIDVASIDTKEPQRDAHLKSDDFFSADTYPTITFRSKRVEPAGEDRYRVVGDLTIRDVTKEVALDTEFEGQVKDPWGGQRAGFSATVELNRKDFGLNWNAALEAGGFVVGDKVKVTLNIEAVRAD